MATTKTKRTAYVLNLEHRPERLERCQALWSPYFELERFPAVHTPDNGSRGCKWSHWFAAQAGLRSDDLVIVLEDDAEPTDAWPKIGLDCIEEARKQIEHWQVINCGPYLDLSGLGMPVAKLSPTRSDLFLKADYCHQTQFMLYSERSLPFLEQSLKNALPIDMFLGRNVPELWVPIRLLATQTDGLSDIASPIHDRRKFWTLSERMLVDAAPRLP